MKSNAILAIGAVGIGLSFAAGAVVSEFQLSPIYGFFSQAFSAAGALKVKTFEYNKKRSTDLWTKTRRTAAGVVLWNKDKAYKGYTFLVSGHAQEAYLLDMKGRTVHKWAMPFRKAWPSHPHIKRLVGEAYMAWRQAVLLPNGDVIVVFIGQGAAPWGYGLARIDKDSNVLWTVDDYFHHDVTLGEDGNIYTLVHRVSKKDIPGLPEVRQPYFRDYAVVYSPDGKELYRIDLLDALVKRFTQTGEEEKLYSFIHRRNGDFLHTNTAKYIPESFADKVPGVEPGQILVSFRSLSMIAAVDPRTQSVGWTLLGPWKRQHDPDPLPNGNLLVFDNVGRRLVGGKSAIMEYNPVTGDVEWLYAGAEQDFDSNIRGVQQKLPNGNVLVTETQGGRVLEITRDKELVWEWDSPFKSAPDMEYTAVVMGATRFAEEELPFLEGL
ncbi:arylsulfotransferase family protein [Pontiella sp.]|uniref:arylsulfotransferase family protein n=1 Tax=Pontiella sp. TaxID=2837462 RepID=UPI0035663D54